MLTIADQWRVQQLRSIIGATAAWHRNGRRGPEPFPGVQPLLVPLVHNACREIGEAERARQWREGGAPGLAALLDAHPELRGS